MANLKTEGETGWAQIILGMLITLNNGKAIKIDKLEYKK